MSDVAIDPVALVNAAPATALCILVYFELRQQRVLIRALSESIRAHGDTLTAVQTAVDLLAQLVGVKLKRKTAPHGIPVVRQPDEE